MVVSFKQIFLTSPFANPTSSHVWLCISSAVFIFVSRFMFCFSVFMSAMFLVCSSFVIVIVCYFSCFAFRL